MKPTTRAVEFALGEEGCLLRIQPDMPATEALDLAADLADGVKYLCDRLASSIDSDSSTVLECELVALGFLAETSSALARSVERSIRKAAGLDLSYAADRERQATPA